MAQQRIVWTVLPHGRVEDGPMAGRLRVSVVAAPRLTPQAKKEQVLKAFAEWRNWPRALEPARFRLRMSTGAVPLEVISKPDPDLWDKFFRDDTPVAGFKFTDMSQVNLRSYSIRNVLGFLRTHYGALAVQSAGSHPTLLPWREAHPSLRGMLAELGTRTAVVPIADRRVEVMAPGFDRFHDDDSPDGLERRLGDYVFGPKSGRRLPIARPEAGDQGGPQAVADAPIRALPPDWQPAAQAGADAQIMAQFNSSAEYAFYQAERFYRRTPMTQARRDTLQQQEQLRRPKNIDVPPPPPVPEWDFHRIVASFADCPRLLRALGLVVDCVLPAGSPIDEQVAAATSAEGSFGLELSWDSAHDAASDLCPRTAWTANKACFTTRARTPDHDRGLLRLAYAHDRWNRGKHSQFDVYQVDPDGAALKTADFLLSAQRLIGKSLALGKPGDVTFTTGDKQPVAALRSGGLGVSRHGRAELLAQSAAATALKNQEIEKGAAAARRVVLFTEDVLRGYRVDVQAVLDDKPGEWQSLCRRHGEYRVLGDGTMLQFADDEGYVKGASTTSGGSKDADPDDHYLHESLFRWAGWSLVAPRPGRTLRAETDPNSGVQNEIVADVADEAESGNGLAVRFTAAKGSLPKLRFGVPYRMRARVVDLAGNSLAYDDRALDENEQATEPVTYWRFEPVDPPALVQRARLSEGESLERMVIRSNWDADAGDYLKSQVFKNARTLPASGDFDYTVVNERHVVPPKAAQLQCEQHALFDELMTDPDSIKNAYAIAAREAGTLYDPLPGSQVKLITPSTLNDVATTPALPPRLPSPDNPTGDRLAAGQYVIHEEAQVTTPYLPDVAAHGLALRAMPGHQLPGVTAPVVLGPGAAVVMTPNQELVLMVDFAKEWPDTQGLRIVLAERHAKIDDPPCKETFADSGPPKWDEKTRVLTFFVPKGRVVRLRYASFVHPRRLDSFGLPAWTDSAGGRDFVRAMAQMGCGWMITPYRPLVLVHATQQPVCAPKFLTLNADRDLGDQHARLGARLYMHGPSTGKFEIEATWKEWVDDLEKAGPELVTGHGQLGEVQLPENCDNLLSLAPAVDAQQPEGGTGPRARGDRHEFGDTKFRRIEYRLRATTRFREYLPEAIYEQREQVTRLGPAATGPAMQVGADDDPGAPVLPAGKGQAPFIAVPASAPPDVPHILYTVPTFRWSGVPGTGKLDTTRLGNGLRVWLERPWFSSGDGELLGVVISAENGRFTDISDELVPLVTQWGLDPLWDTALPKYSTRATDFPARVSVEDVLLQESPGTRVRVVGHRVRWDDDRKLWYCDIELDPGASYMPFVRLALVRYQPNALDEAKISKVALAEFSQVLPRRRAVFEKRGGQLAFAMHGEVPVHGPMKFPVESEFLNISFMPPLGSTPEAGRNKAELVLQVRDQAMDSDLAWSDFKVLASTLLPAPAAPPGAGKPLAGGVASKRAAAAATSKVKQSVSGPVKPATSLDRGGRTKASSVTGVGIAGRPKVIIGSLILDPAIWDTTVSLPDVGGKPARIVVREYERYYTDRFVQAMAAGKLRERRVVEERLVFTAFFDL